MTTTVVIPCRETENAYITLHSLGRQSILPSEVYVIYDQGNGASWARNRGFKAVKTKYVLFSDNDIEWLPTALESLQRTLDLNPECSVAYGWYVMEGQVIGNHIFNPKTLWGNNYISTMSLIRADHFPGFDESLQRLQDWDLWLTMVERGYRFVFCPQQLFSTKKRDGITFGNGISWQEAYAIVKAKHESKWR